MHFITVSANKSVCLQTLHEITRMATDEVLYYIGATYLNISCGRAKVCIIHKYCSVFETINVVVNISPPAQVTQAQYPGRPGSHVITICNISDSNVLQSHPMLIKDASQQLLHKPMWLAPIKNVLRYEIWSNFPFCLLSYMLWNLKSSWRYGISHSGQHEVINLIVVIFANNE